MKKILELKSLTAGYDEKIVLKGVNLVVKENDFLGIIGPNGGGKTTLLKVILGTIKPVEGEILPDGNDRCIIGYLPQINQIDNKFPIPVKEVVLSGLMSHKKIFGRYNSENKRRADELMTQMGIIHLKNKNIGELSGGQLQRVFLCRAIIADPKLLILDEPDTYVDSNFEGELYEILHHLNSHMAIIIVSHDVGTICSHVKSIACVNETLCYHDSNVISQEQLMAYNCPIDLITHGEVPHRVLKHHK
ncbi:metal ABC transporter ATP-binding protein [Labilibaculum manganireducens]|uniref:Zinc ABC transporter ATP-binding protein n=1 Tax=Labilibaculum manganireducens TaxID=1940525 RepID=A0A2N3HUG9_9BACT|nr:ABC transporter ATP-binding protein [Labilibaculum manganireducens]PKQ61671.1 zinc ABC transporter ATP-binding protein [Labilibaculum manganireducens]